MALGILEGGCSTGGWVLTGGCTGGWVAGGCVTTGGCPAGPIGVEEIMVGRLQVRQVSRRIDKAKIERFIKTSLFEKLSY